MDDGRSFSVDSLSAVSVVAIFARRFEAEGISSASVGIAIGGLSGCIVCLFAMARFAGFARLSMAANMLSHSDFLATGNRLGNVALLFARRSKAVNISSVLDPSAMGWIPVGRPLLRSGIFARLSMAENILSVFDPLNMGGILIWNAKAGQPKFTSPKMWIFRFGVSGRTLSFVSSFFQGVFVACSLKLLANSSLETCGHLRDPPSVFPVFSDVALSGG